MIKFLDLKKQYSNIKNEIDEAIHNVIEESAFINGRFVKEFTDSFAKYSNAKYCIGVGNGTDALEIAIESLNLPKNSEIIVPANSFIASSEAITRNRYKIVFCDCDEENYTISVSDLESKITPNTQAILVVHLYGHPADMEKVSLIAKEHDLKIIEDCAQAHGSEYNGQKVGTLGDIATFSFYPGKNLGAYGDGGAITTNDEQLAKKAQMIANHGRLDKYNHQFEGRNSRLDGIQAAILSVKLKYLDKWIEHRRGIAELYNQHLKDFKEIILPKEEKWAKHSYHLFVIRAQNRDALKQHLEKNGVEVGIHYPISLPNLNAYKHLQQQNKNRFSTLFEKELLSLPIGEHITDQDVIEISNLIKEFYNR